MAESLHRDCSRTRNLQVTENKQFGAKIWNRTTTSMADCTDLFTTFAPARSPLLQMSPLGLAVPGEHRAGQRRCRSGASPPAAPAMSQALSAQAHRSPSSRGPSETITSSGSVRDALSQSSGSLCPHVNPRPILKRALFPLVRTSWPSL